MENASKALIIAGAILLSIIIISLGLVVVNNVRDTISGNNLSAEQKQAFNSKLSVYEGMNVSGSQVNALIQQVIQVNTEAGRDNTGTFVGIAFPTASDLSGKRYKSINVNTTDGSVAYHDLAAKPAKGLEDIANTCTAKTTDVDLSRVATGKTYKVTSKMTDGVISHIFVEAN